MVLEGFGDTASKIVTFCMDEVGRWRIVRPEAYDFEEYQDKDKNGK